MLGTWPCPGDAGPELALSCDSGSDTRILILPALFEEGNKLRHFTVEVMRALKQRGIDSFLPDFSGCNESIAPMAAQTLVAWQEQARAAAEHFGATFILTVRASALLDPGNIAGLRYAPLDGAGVLKSMLRARVMSDREAGINSDREALLEDGKRNGLRLGGYELGAQMITQLAEAEFPHSAATSLAQSAIGGGALWLRAEPSHDAEQAEKLAAIVSEAVG